MKGRIFPDHAMTLAVVDCLFHHNTASMIFSSLFGSDAFRGEFRPIYRFRIRELGLCFSRASQSTR
jgi:hypothetical protein